MNEQELTSEIKRFLLLVESMRMKPDKKGSIKNSLGYILFTLSQEEKPQLRLVHSQQGGKQ